MPRPDLPGPLTHLAGDHERAEARACSSSSVRPWAAG